MKIIKKQTVIILFTVAVQVWSFYVSLCIKAKGKKPFFDFG